MISLLIATKNRPVELKRCLRFIQRCQYRNLEIILSDQGNSLVTKEIVQNFPSLNIKYLSVSEGGKSSALNAGLKISRGDIVALTDDDCVVDKNWLSNIEKYLLLHPEVAGVLGKTLPYEPHLHKGLVCRTIFNKKKTFTTSNPYIIHYKKLGIGNNMTFRRTVFHAVGGFIEWLGVGSVSRAGGIEGEFIYRVLKHSNKLAYEPSIVVYHDKWLSKEAEEILQTKYITGTTAFYCYYIRLTGDLNLLRNLYDLRFHVTEKLKQIGKQLRRGHVPRQTIYYLFLDLRSFILGALLGFKQARIKLRNNFI